MLHQWTVPMLKMGYSERQDLPCTHLAYREPQRIDTRLSIVVVFA